MAAQTTVKPASLSTSHLTIRQKREFQSALDDLRKENQAQLDDLYEEARIQVANEFDTAEGGEREQLHAAQSKLREEVQKLNALQRGYYESVRNAWKAITGTDLSPYEWKQVTADRALWQSVGGYSDTQFNGLTFTQLANGESQNGLTLDDLWARSTKAYDDEDWMSLADDVMKRAGRMCLHMTAEADRSNPRYARVPKGPTCGFCIMLASRGFVYYSAESAGERGLPWNSFHYRCNCQVVPSWGPMSIENYDPDAMKERYKECRAAVEKLFDREQYAIETKGMKNPPKYNYWFTKKVTEEMDWRDRHWMWNGRIPKAGMTRQLAKSGQQLTDGELRTAKALAGHGIKCVFHVNTYTDKTGTHGLTTLADGTQFSTLQGASSVNTIKSHIHTALKKKGLRRIIVDNSQNKGLSDKQLEKYIEQNESLNHSDSKHDVGVYIIGHDAELMRVW